MLAGIIAGCIVGALWKDAAALEPLGTVFVNLMFCVVVPMVFCSISSAIANMASPKQAGKVLGITIVTFACTSTIASVIMYATVRFLPVFTMEPQYEAGEPEVIGISDLIVNFFTKPDFSELLSRRAILPLIVAAILFGFGVQMAGGRKTQTAAFLSDVTNCLMKTVRIITYYAPIGFFGYFASLVATHGEDFVTNYARAIIVYYVVSILYMAVFFPVYARFGGGKGAVKVMLKHLFKPENDTAVEFILAGDERGRRYRAECTGEYNRKKTMYGLNSAIYEIFGENPLDDERKRILISDCSGSDIKKEIRRLKPETRPARKMWIKRNG